MNNHHPYERNNFNPSIQNNTVIQSQDGHKPQYNPYQNRYYNQQNNQSAFVPNFRRAVS